MSSARFTVLLVFIASCLSVTCAGIPSFTKYHGINVRGCDHMKNYSSLFNLNTHPSLWNTCNDAYSYTWSSSYLGKHSMAFFELSEVDALKLIASSGFCPHLRCQLGNVSNSGTDEKCPAGLCYTKLENGSPSFGACCYSDGKFDSGDLIGVFSKTQPAPKPIYKHSRVVLRSPGLGDSSLVTVPEWEEVSENAFINANEVFPGLIMTQCPLINHSAPSLSTLADALLMVVQQNISTWVQIMSGADATLHTSLRRQCHIFPLLDFRDLELDHRLSVKDVHVYSHGHGGDGVTLPTGFPYANHSVSANLSQDSQLNFVNIEFTVVQATAAGAIERNVQYIWFNHWPDFGVPDEDEDETVGHIVSTVVGRVREGQKVAVSCMSGRGRSGTLGALIAATYSGVGAGLDRTVSVGQLNTEANGEGFLGNSSAVGDTTALSQLVNLIVVMRSHRDGLVELPDQFFYVRRLLGLI